MSDSIKRMASENYVQKVLESFVPSGCVPATRKVNGKALSEDISLDASDVGACGNNDSRLSDTRDPNAHGSTHGTSGTDPITPSSIGAAPSSHTHAIADVTGLAAALAQKADADALPYALSTIGSWLFSGVPEGTASASVSFQYDTWTLTLTDAVGDTTTDMVGGDGSENDIYFSTVGVTATRNHLLDRAGNRVVVTGATELTLPEANPGHIRDFLVRLEISGSTVPTIAFDAPTGETITYETDGDEFPVPDEAGTWIYSFTENCVAHKFAVSLKKVNTVAQGGL